MLLLLQDRRLAAAASADGAHHQLLRKALHGAHHTLSTIAHFHDEVVRSIAGRARTAVIAKLEVALDSRNVFAGHKEVGAQTIVIPRVKRACEEELTKTKTSD